jgi:uncharacterized protein YfiM (DUF2279 family)
MAADLPDFDIAALHAALGEQRVARGLSWEGVAREISATGAGLTSRRPVSASTLTGMLTRRSLEANIVLLELRWLGRTPESFIPGHPAPTTAQTALPDLPPEQVLRWDLPALHAALDSRRRERGMTWKQVAAEIRGFTPGMLTGLTRADHIGVPRVMRLVTWLEQPAVAFTVVRPRGYKGKPDR